MIREMVLGVEPAVTNEVPVLLLCGRIWSGIQLLPWCPRLYHTRVRESRLCGRGGNDVLQQMRHTALSIQPLLLRSQALHLYFQVPSHGQLASAEHLSCYGREGEDKQYKQEGVVLKVRLCRQRRNLGRRFVGRLDLIAD